MKLNDYINNSNNVEEKIVAIQQNYILAEETIENLQAGLDSLKNSILKIGYSVKQLDERTFELVKSREIAETGEYTNPIPYYDGMEVTKGLWYALGDGNIWECIKNGSDSHMTSEWFDIIE